MTEHDVTKSSFLKKFSTDFCDILLGDVKYMPDKVLKNVTMISAVVCELPRKHGWGWGNIYPPPPALRGLDQTRRIIVKEIQYSGNSKLWVSSQSRKFSGLSLSSASYLVLSLLRTVPSGSVTVMLLSGRFNQTHISEIRHITPLLSCWASGLTG